LYNSKLIIFIFFKDVNIDGHKILFEDIQREGTHPQIKFTGIPFLILGKKDLDCSHGIDRDISTKKKRKEKKIQEVLYIIK